jgi:hypothetical protein
MIAKIKDMRTIYLTGRFIRFRQSVFCAFCFVLCSCGNIFSSMSDAGLELSAHISSLRADQLRNEYALTPANSLSTTTNIFTPATDLTVYALYPNGTIHEIPIKEVMITLLYGHGEVGERVEYEDSVPFYDEADLGEWCYQVSYGGKSARFAFYVRTKLEDPVVPDDPNSGGGIDVGIKWRD